MVIHRHAVIGGSRGGCSKSDGQYCEWDSDLVHVVSFSKWFKEFYLVAGVEIPGELLDTKWDKPHGFLA
jgi:hypothetical protein